MARLFTFVLAAMVLSALIFSSQDSAHTAGGIQTIINADTAGDTGYYTSLVLDASGNPVVSYGRADTEDLKVLHCGNPSCSSGNVIATPDTVGSVGLYTSIELDSAGNPVVSYYREDTGNLKVLHCGDPTCTASNTIASPDTGGDVGPYSSLELNSAGNPIVAYYRYDTGDLKVLHCGNPNCTSGNIISTPDTAGDTGHTISLKLDGNGRPVISYYRIDTGDLKVLHCGNPFCTAGNTITTPDAAGDTGLTTSLELDATGKPIVSYLRFDTGDLKVLHCGNANCTAGNVIATPDTIGDTGGFASLKVDAAGNPVVSYWRYDTEDLKLLHCGNPNCTAGNVITSPDTAGEAGAYTSQALDAIGNPVVSYNHFGIARDLKVLHCNNPFCSGVKLSTPTPSHTPTITNTPTVTPTPTEPPTPTPKNLAGDTDGDTAMNDVDENDDGDGCTDTQETGPDKTDGGMRDPHNFWDFFDVPTSAALTRDGSISAADIFAVIGRFNSSGASNIDPLSMPGPPPAFHTAYDRGPSVGLNTWNLGPPNGSVAATDIFAVIGQFNDSCA